MCLTPTMAAAKIMAERLPYIGIPQLKSDSIFHLLTDDLTIVDETIRMAVDCRKQYDGNRYRNIEPLIWSFDTMIAKGSAEVKDPSTGKVIARSGGFTFNALMKREDIRNRLIFVIRPYLEDYETENDRLFHDVVQTYVMRSLEIDCDFEPTPGYFGVPFEQQLIFVVYGRNCRLPGLLKTSANTIEYPPLTAEDFRTILVENYTAWHRDRVKRAPDKMPVLTDDTLKWYVDHLGRLPERQVRRIIDSDWELLDGYYGRKGWENKDRAKFYQDEEIQEALDSHIRAYKNGVLNQNGYLAVKANEAGEILGVDKMDKWFDEHREAMKLVRDAPSGIVLAGPPGTGKSSAAKLAAKKFGLSLVQLEMDRILGDHVGDSEKNMRAMLEDLKNAAPCVLWIDELEKVLSGSEGGKSSGDGGVMRRLMGMLLSFMQENNTTVFIAATANDIGGFPEEFFRNGRFDQVFSVMLPDYQGCVSLMRSKLEKYLAVKGQAYSLDDARAVLNCFIGTREAPRFLTGADIDTYAKKILWHFGSRTMPPRDELLKMIEKFRIPEKVRAQVPADAQTSMALLAKRYLDLISYNFTLVGGESAFKRELMHLDRARFFWDDGKRRELPMCFDYEGGPEALEARCSDEDPAVWYDAVFFRELNKAMFEVVINDRKLTPPQTEMEYWKYKTRMAGRPAEEARR